MQARDEARAKLLNPIMVLVDGFAPIYLFYDVDELVESLVARFVERQRNWEARKGQ